MAVSNSGSDLTAERIAEIRALRESTISSASVSNDEATALADLAAQAKGRGGDPLSVLLAHADQPYNTPPAGLAYSRVRLLANGGAEV